MSEVIEIIAQEIEAQGVISFARFMELALYCPVFGYYEKEVGKVGRCGDYYTSVSVGTLFGELLGFQFAEWLHTASLGAGESQGIVQIVEAGAHDGRLAQDILAWVRDHRPGLFERLQYCILEPSCRRREWQERQLRNFEGRVRWASGWRELGGSGGLGDGSAASGGIRGVIFANELLDSLPTHRLVWDAEERRWVEWGITLGHGEFRWARMGQTPGPGGGEAVGLTGEEHWLGLSRMMPQGFEIEWCPAAQAWWREAADVLAEGRLLTIDYGLTVEELLMSGTRAGTIRAYHGHRLSRDVLSSAGEQDITSHVNFTMIRAAGESAGLRTEALRGQGEFLTSIVRRLVEGQREASRWTAEQTRQFQTLTHPEFLGTRFRVLVQARGV